MLKIIRETFTFPLDRPSIAGYNLITMTNGNNNTERDMNNDSNNPWYMSDAVANAAVAYEDGDTDTVDALVATFDAADVAAFAEEVAILNRKMDRADAIARDIRREANRIMGCNAARNSTRAIVSGAADYEDRILARHEREELELGC